MLEINRDLTYTIDILTNELRLTRRKPAVSGVHPPCHSEAGATKVLTVASEAGAREMNSCRRSASLQSLVL